LLTDNLQDFAIPLTEFTSTNGMPLVLNDVKTIVFKMTALDGKSTVKEMDLQTIQFSKSLTLSVAENGIESSENNFYVAPNPIVNKSIIHFRTAEDEKVYFEIFNVTGKVVKRISVDAQSGQNQVPFSKSDLTSGIYFCKLISKVSKYNVIKLIVK
jgi:hypothetical protein